MAARFKKMVDVTADSTCKDTIISPFFSDVFDGQATTFSRTGVTDPVDGVVNFGRGVFPTDYICEFPMPPKPGFGEADLYSLELNLYFTGLRKDNDYTNLTLEAYKMKEELATEGNFNTGTSSDDNIHDIFFASSMPLGTTVLTEDFSGGVLGTASISGFKSTTGFMYMLLNDAWDHLANTSGAESSGALNARWRAKADNMWKGLGRDMYNGQKIIKVKRLTKFDTQSGKSTQATADRGYISVNKHKAKFWPDIYQPFIMQKKEVESNIHFSGAVVDNEDLTNTTIDIDDSDLITRALSTKDFYTRPSVCGVYF